MKQKYISYWENAVQHSNKLEFYNIFKNQYKTSHYLDHTSEQTERKALVKLRMDNHKPMIEIGRYEQIPHEQRICPVCMSTNLVDEIHFLFHCLKYSTLRGTFFNHIYLQLPNVWQTNITETIKILINSTNYLVNLPLIKFISSCFVLHDRLISSNQNSSA